MDEMTWTDPQLKARYERNLKAMEQRRAAHPELFNKWALPYKVFTRSSLHGIQNMRINHAAVSATHCRDCGEEIPERRRELVAGCQRCADCQEEEELRGKHRR